MSIIAREKILAGNADSDASYPGADPDDTSFENSSCCC